MSPIAQNISARELILTLIDSAAGSLTASYFVSAGELFQMDSGSIRVALARLIRDGSLKQVERGVYGLGSRGGTLHSLVRNWSHVEMSLKPWGGGWLGVFTAHLGRGNKTQVRSRDRALTLFGFAALEAGFWVRPDNLVADLPSLQTSLRELGLDEAAFACVMAELIPEANIQPRLLWDRDLLERRYRDHSRALSESMARLPALDGVAAAKETLLIGRAVTRDILLDPLLPPELVNASLRHEMIEAMRAYDRQGKAFWREFLASHG